MTHSIPAMLTAAAMLLIGCATTPAGTPATPGDSGGQGERVAAKVQTPGPGPQGGETPAAISEIPPAATQEPTAAPPAATAVPPASMPEAATTVPPAPTQEVTPVPQTPIPATSTAVMPEATPADSQKTVPAGPPGPVETAAPFGCGDFDSWEEANRFFLENGGPDADPYHLDTDGDTIPCNAQTDQGADTRLYPAPVAVTPFEGNPPEDCLTPEAREALLTAEPGALAAAAPHVAENIAACLPDRELAERTIVRSAAAQADLSGETRTCLATGTGGRTVRRVLEARAAGGQSMLLTPALEYAAAAHWATCLNAQEWQQTGMTERDQAHARCLAAGEGGTEAMVSLMLGDTTPEEAARTAGHAARCAASHPADPLPECGPPGPDGTRPCP